MESNNTEPNGNITLLAEAILNDDIHKVNTILSLYPDIATNPRFIKRDIFQQLQLDGNSALIRESLYSAKWFPHGNSFGIAIRLAVEYDKVDVLRWYFSRWRESYSLPLSPELKEEFRESLRIAVENSKLVSLSILLLRGIHRLTGALQDMCLLHDAIRRRNSDVLRLLLDAGFDTNSTPDGVLLPIEVALAAGRVDDVRLLIQHGAIVHVTSTPSTSELLNPFSEFSEGQSWIRSMANGYPWAHQLVEQSFIEKYDLLSDFIHSANQATAISPDDRTLAHELIKDKGWALSSEKKKSERAILNAKRLNLLSRVLDAGVSPNQVDRDGWTPVFQAVAIDDMEALSIMKHSMDVNLCTEIGTALILACQKNNSYIAKWLLEHGADPTQHDLDGTSTLEYATEYGDTILESLVRKSIDNHQKNK